MRAASDLPRPRRRGLGNRGRIGLVVLAVALFLLLISLRGIAGFYTDLLWFDSLGYRSTFTGILGAKAVLTILFVVLFFVVLWVNLFVADRLAPRFRPAGPEEEVIERYHELIGHRTGLVRVGVAAVFALIAGAGVGSHWNDWILFLNGGDFGIKDRQFDTDVGFYVFKLPFLSFVVDWAFASFVIVLIVVAVAHYLNGGIRLQGAAQRVTPQVKAHLSVLLGMLAAVKAVDYYLQRFELTFSSRGVVDGASNTDVKAQLPALQLLMLISLAAVVLLIVNIRRRGWVLPALAVGLWAFVAIVVGGVYPALYQRFRVEPAESSREEPYIERNIEATRAALGLETENLDFAATGEITTDDLDANASVVRNIRLWDPEQMEAAFGRLQARRTQYTVNDVDIDRYMVNGELTQVELGVRDLNPDGIPQSSWEGRHLIYTHGHGVIMAPANAKDRSGRPDLIVRDVPVRSDAEEIQIEQPGVYIGEGLGGYAIINTDRREVDFEGDDGETVLTTYDGADGVGIGSYLRRAAFALRFADVNPLFSGNIRSDSKILFQRDVRERIETLAPFLSFDHDPYPVVVDGGIKYVIDAYTTSNRYPYGQGANREGLDSGSGLNHNFNYVRNSVKAVVDAYEGSVTFYVVDESDPLIRAYRKAFPELFTDGDEVPEELEAHFRYPEDLFVVQTNMWGRYHLDAADDFYTNTGAWTVAQDPDLDRTATTAAPGQLAPAVSSQVKRISPQYLLTQLPGEDEPSFLIFRPFVPVSRGEEERIELTAFMVAKSDPGSYGDLITYVLPPAAQVDGPVQAAANMAQDAQVSETLTLLNRSGSSATLGNLVMVPIEQSLLYVRPLYVEATGAEIPEIRYVVASFQGQVAMEVTLSEALGELFDVPPPATQEEEPVDDGTAPPGGPGQPTEPDQPDQTVAELLGRASTAFDEADAALREGDLATFQEKVEEGRGYVQEARRREGGDGSTAPASTTTTTTEPPEA